MEDNKWIVRIEEGEGENSGVNCWVLSSDSPTKEGDLLLDRDEVLCLLSILSKQNGERQIQ